MPDQVGGGCGRGWQGQRGDAQIDRAAVIGRPERRTGAYGVDCAARTTKGALWAALGATRDGSSEPAAVRARRASAAS